MAVIAIRSDFLGQLQSAATLTARFEEFSLGPMPLARVPQIIQGPAKVAGVNVEEAFVQQAARDAATEDALPLLAFALRELWDRSPNKSLSLEGYKAFGDEKGGLTPLENAVREATDAVLAEAKPADDELVALREAFVPAMACRIPKDFICSLLNTTSCCTEVEGVAGLAGLLWRRTGYAIEAAPQASRWRSGAGVTARRQR
jgi:hypothetical protein